MSTFPNVPTVRLYTISLAMQDIGRMETPVRVLDKIDIPPLLEVQTDSMVDSMSPPHAAEHMSAQHELAQDCATLQLIDEDIEECRMRIARAHAQMRSLELRLRAVPDQVLQEIFQHCLPDNPYIEPDARSAPLVLTHVCRRWRAVVQGTSELWSSIALHDRGVWNYELEVQMVKRWLDQSRMRPIRMSITCPPRTDFGRDGNALCSDIFQLVIAHSAQLRDLCLNCYNPSSSRFMPSIVSTNPRKQTRPAFVPAPNLRRIAFKGDGTSINFISRAIFPQITHLSLDCNMILDLALLFRDFPSLQHLTLTLSLSRDALRFQIPPQRDHRIVVPSLLYFEVCLGGDMLDFGDPERLETVFNQLDLPALRTLSIAAPLRPRYDKQDWTHGRPAGGITWYGCAVPA
ncbi:hypothetical protein J3R83DRAFT_4322 [Lanmaoa asiatica]|nr:hypothetical protein J3R83DRAFT_4322 [Lanmaoa asiatica]